MKNGRNFVCVVGGGIAGVSAAISAAREGARVILLEREFLPGGLATAGLIAFYLPLCDGRGHQLSFGLAEELLLLSVSTEEQSDVKAQWQSGLGSEPCPRYRCEFQPNVFALLLERALIEAGVEIRYGVQVCAAETENGRLVSITAQDKYDRFTLHPDAVIDATGDAAVCTLAGAPTEVFAEGNALASWYYDTSRSKLSLCVQGAFDDPDAAISEAKNAGKVYSGLNSEDVSAFCLSAHRCILSSYLEKKKKDPSLMLSTLPTVPQYRMVRRLSGSGLITTAADAAFCPDSIGMIGDWRLSGPIYEIPYSCLYTDQITNLFAAGKCISAEGEMWDQTRVIPACAVTGEAAGIAAARTAEGERCSCRELQTRLQERGIPLHF